MKKTKKKKKTVPTKLKVLSSKSLCKEERPRRIFFYIKILLSGIFFSFFIEFCIV